MGPRVLCCWEWGMVQSLRRTVWQVLRKLNMLPYEPAIALLRDLLRRKKKLISKKKKFCTQMLRTALLMLAQSWRQQRSFSGSWVSKLVSRYHATLLSIKKTIKQTNQLLVHNNSDQFPGTYSEWKKLMPKHYTFYGFIHVTLLKRQDFRNVKQISGWHGPVMGWGTEDKRVIIKGQNKGPCSQVTIQYLLCFFKFF